MAVTATQIRDLLNRPRGLNEGTIDEYITVRTAEVAKIARASGYVGVTTNAPSDALKDGAVKFLVCVDCLRVLVDTVPSWVPEKEQGTQDIRYNKQLASFEKAAQKVLSEIAEHGGTAYQGKATATRVGGTPSGAELAGSLFEN
tara:strand:- start:102 stop:533 length:432 start_codon:yes stop_codon:yes gene_type:complete